MSGDVPGAVGDLAQRLGLPIGRPSALPQDKAAKSPRCMKRAIRC
jgi:hypothetical protein